MTISTTTRLGIYRWDSASDSFTRLHLDTSHANLESKVAGFSSGTRASAAAAYEGFFHFGSGETLSYCNGSAWFDIGKSGTAVELDGTLSSGSGTDLALANHKHSIGANVIDNTMMKDNAINSDEIVDGAVTEGKIFGGAVTNDKLASSGLSATKLTTGTLDCSAVTVSNLPASAVPNLDASKINDGEFASDRIPTIALGTDTSGNYVETVAAGAGLAVTGADSEGATKTIAHNTTGAASVDNSNGNVIQDLTIDVNGHVTATGTKDLDTVYYTQTEINSQLGGDPATDTTDRLLYGYSSVASRNANASKCIWITTATPSSPEVGDIWIDLN